MVRTCREGRSCYLRGLKRRAGDVMAAKLLVDLEMFLEMEVSRLEL